MIHMKSLTKYTLMTSLLIGGVACTNLDEQLLDRYTQNFSPSNQGVGNKNNVNKAQPNDGMQGAFSKLLNGHATNGGFFAVQETGTDEAVITQKGGDWYDGGLYIRMHHHEFSPQTWAINDTWSNAYSGIFQCNDLLAGSLDNNQKAQLRVLRAYFYWQLLDVFGNVKIVTAANSDAPQATRLDVYNFVVAELVAALPDLADGKQDYGRISKGAANALLSRVYLNAKEYSGTAQYQKAIDAADEVINSGVYSLSASYAAVFAPDNVENSEHIFVIPFDESTGQGSSWPMMTLHYPSQLTYKLQQQPWNGFSTLEDFYNSYETNDSRKAASFVAGPQLDFSGNPILDLAYDKADEDGPAVNYTPAINELFPNASRQAGARFGKFAFKIGQSPNADNDFPILRYGEVLLNKAEALCRLNGWTDPTAVALIDQLRTRAGVGTIAPLTEGKFLEERGREMFVEEIRRTDLIRFGVYGDAWWEKPVDANAAAHNLMAIPIEQIQAAASSTFTLTQNPGY